MAIRFALSRWAIRWRRRGRARQCGVFHRIVRRHACAAHSDIGLISIIAKSPVAAGVRRIEAKTGLAARRHLNSQAQRFQEMAHLLKAPEDEAGARLAHVLDERRKLERELSDARKRLAMSGGAADAPIEDVGGIKFFRKEVSGVEMKDFGILADEASKVSVPASLRSSASMRRVKPASSLASPMI